MGLSAPVAPLPYSGEGVRLFGDTPMLLRETDRSMPAGAAFTRPTVDSTTLVSPEVSNDMLRIGSETFATTGAGGRVLHDGVINAGKGLVGMLEVTGAADARIYKAHTPGKAVAKH